MVNEQIVAYAATERARGVTESDIRGALEAKGWKLADINDTLGGGVGAVDAGPRSYTFRGLVEGRLMRWQYFVTSLLLGLCLVGPLLAVGIFAGFSAIAGGYENSTDMPSLLTILAMVVLYVCFIPLQVALIVRRIHDIGWSGWTILFYCVPVVNAFFGIAVLFIKGTVGTNKYGPEQADRPFVRTLLNT